jgi:uncharacterized protein
MDDALQTLHPRAVTLWRATAALRGGFLTLAVLVAEILLDLPAPRWLPTGALAVVVAAAAALVPPLRYRAWRWALRRTDIFLRHGILFRTVSIVPLVRIQHVDTRHGPVDRALGLADVVVYTAGSRGAIVTIPALGRAQAEALRDRLAELSGAGDAV